MGGRPGVGPESNLTNRSKGWTAEQRKKSAATRKANRDGQAVALALISDKEYVKNLRKRLRDGSAGPIENLLWLLAHGKPREQTTGEDQQARITEVREAAKKAIRAGRSRLALAPGPVIEAEVVEKAGGNGQP